jgi:hypothetical protein
MLANIGVLGRRLTIALLAIPLAFAASWANADDHGNSTGRATALGYNSGCGLTITSSTETISPELTDFLPELGPAPSGVGQCPQAEDDLGAFGFPAHAGGT